MAFKIEISSDKTTIRFCPIGYFNSNMAANFWKHCTPKKRLYQTYVIDFAQVFVISDSSYVWLDELSEWAERAAVNAHFVNASHIGWVRYNNFNQITVN